MPFKRNSLACAVLGVAMMANADDCPKLTKKSLMFDDAIKKLYTANYWNNLKTNDVPFNCEYFRVTIQNDTTATLETNYIEKNEQVEKTFAVAVSNDNGETMFTTLEDFPISDQKLALQHLLVEENLLVSYACINGKPTVFANTHKTKFSADDTTKIGKIMSDYGISNVNLKDTPCDEWKDQSK